MNTPYGNIVVKKGVVVNEQEFRQHLGAYTKVMGRSAAKLLKKQARLFCDDMLDYTMPFDGMGHDGRSRVAQKIGQDVVEGQIENIFMPLQYVSAGEILNHNSESVFSAWLRARKKLSNPMLPNWLKNGNNFVGLWRKFQKWKFAKESASSSSGSINLNHYNKGSGVIKTLHVQARGGNTVAEYFDNMDKQSIRYVVDDDGKEVASYIKRVKAHVGRLKAGWYSVGSQLGRIKNVGYWIRGNQWGTGIIMDQLSNNAVPSITVGNKVQGLHRSTKDGFRLALNYRAYSMREEMYQKLVKSGRADVLYRLATHHSLAGGFDIT
jgi:hypothetical protein